MKKTNLISSIMEKNFIKSFSLFPYRPENFGGKQLALRSCGATARMRKFFEEGGSVPETLIVFLIPYDFENSPSHLAPESNLCRYSRIPDYHCSVEKIADEIIADLRSSFPENLFAHFTDNSPFYEVELAATANLGVVGDNGLLISELFGSWVFISTIISDIPFESVADGFKSDFTIKGCTHCGICEKACPASCIGGDKSTCLSAITQKKGGVDKLSPREISLIKKGGSAWGCDICAEVCPMNKDKLKEPHPSLVDGSSEYILKISPALLYELSSMEKNVPRAWDWRGEKVLRRNLSIIDE